MLCKTSSQDVAFVEVYQTNSLKKDQGIKIHLNKILCWRMSAICNFWKLMVEKSQSSKFCKIVFFM